MIVIFFNISITTTTITKKNHRCRDLYYTEVALALIRIRIVKTELQYFQIRPFELRTHAPGIKSNFWLVVVYMYSRSRYLLHYPIFKGFSQNFWHFFESLHLKIVKFQKDFLRIVHYCRVWRLARKGLCNICKF